MVLLPESAALKRKKGGTAQDARKKKGVPVKLLQERAAYTPRRLPTIRRTPDDDSVVFPDPETAGLCTHAGIPCRYGERFCGARFVRPPTAPLIRRHLQTHHSFPTLARDAAASQKMGNPLRSDPTRCGWSRCGQQMRWDTVPGHVALSHVKDNLVRLGQEHQALRPPLPWPLKCSVCGRGYAEERRCALASTAAIVHV